MSVRLELLSFPFHAIHDMHDSRSLTTRYQLAFTCVGPILVEQDMALARHLTTRGLGPVKNDSHR
jgi:hypothetical protein